MNAFAATGKMNRRVSPRFFMAASFAFTIFALTNVASAEGFDFETELLARTHSPALSINPVVGYGQKIWGDTETPWYGFVRPTLTGVLSPSLYEGKIGIEIFPVSILGLDLKRTYSRRFSETRGENCFQVQCLGELNYTDFSLQSYLGFASYYSSIRWTRTFFDAVEDKTRNVYELGAHVLIKPDGDAGDYLTIVAGREMKDVFDRDLSFGVLIQTADFRYSGHHQEGQYFIVRSDLEFLGWQNFEATVGLGRFKSTLGLPEFSAVLSVTYAQTRAIGYGH